MVYLQSFSFPFHAHKQPTCTRSSRNQLIGFFFWPKPRSWYPPYWAVGLQGREIFFHAAARSLANPHVWTNSNQLFKTNPISAKPDRNGTFGSSVLKRFAAPAAWWQHRLAIKLVHDGPARSVVAGLASCRHVQHVTVPWTNFETNFSLKKVESAQHLDLPVNLHTWPVSNCRVPFLPNFATFGWRFCSPAVLWCFSRWKRKEVEGRDREPVFYLPTVCVCVCVGVCVCQCVSVRVLEAKPTQIWTDQPAILHRSWASACVDTWKKKLKFSPDPPTLVKKKFFYEFKDDWPC